MNVDLKETHILLNKLYSMANKDYQELLGRNVDCSLKNYKYNYIKLEEKYHKQEYPIPIIECINMGDIGYNLDKVFFEFSFGKNEFLNLNFSYIMKNFEDIEMYGGGDCLVDFYEKGDLKKDIINKFKSSNEEIAMVSLYFEHYKVNLTDLFLEVCKNII